MSSSASAAAAPPSSTSPRWGIALAVFVITGAIYGVLALWVGRTKSPTMAYYPALAAAFLQGRLDLGNPEVIRDLTQSGDAWYLAFPPLPAILMMPETLAQRALVNSVRYSIASGAAAAAFVFLLLDAMARRRWTQLPVRDNLWLTALFAFGSVAFYISMAGTVWLTSQIVAVTFVAAAAWLSVEWASPLPAGTALALAILARVNLALTWPFLIGLAATRLGASASGRPSAVRRWAVASLIPVGGAVTLLLAYNQARFGNPLDFGYATMSVSPDLSELFQRYGQFDIHFLPRNLWVLLFALPRWNAGCGFWSPNPWGLSLLLTMPVLVYLVRASPRSSFGSRRGSPWMIGAWTSIGLMLLVLLVYHNTGYYQFGYRFSLDFLVPLMALLAAAGRDGLSRTYRGLIVAGIVINFLGMAWFFEMWCKP